jgi:hypothetical protein
VETSIALAGVVRRRQETSAERSILIHPFALSLSFSAFRRAARLAGPTAGHSENIVGFPNLTSCRLHRGSLDKTTCVLELK